MCNETTTRNVYVWGTGKCAQELIETALPVEHVVAFVDNDKSKTDFLGKKVILPEQLEDREYDAVIVAVEQPWFQYNIYRQCALLGLDSKKLIFLHRTNAWNSIITLDEANNNYHLAEEILGVYAQKVYSEYEKVRDLFVSVSKGHSFKNSTIFTDDMPRYDYHTIDYVRVKTFEMISEEIKKHRVPGETAELGVFRGDFSQYINMAFPDRKLYLFDTFEGFDESEARDAVEKGYCDDNKIQIFKCGSIEEVFKKLKHPNKAIVKKGLFPASLDGLEERFAFVSLDVDMEESTLEGLRYFYPRLSEGGYIFIHDYNPNTDEGYDFRGIEDAVARYEEETGIHLHKVPIADRYGSLIISK